MGNVGVLYTKDPVDGLTKIVEENNYYPFGLKHANYNSYVPVNTYNYKYNGKELQREFGLNMYDYGARNYDPAIGRWMNMDPLAENHHENNPYMYANNNPVIFVDPDGKDFTLTGVAAQDFARGLQRELRNADDNGYNNEISNSRYEDNDDKNYEDPPKVGQKVLEAKKTLLGKIWGTLEKREWTDPEFGITYLVNADGTIFTVRPIGGMGAMGLVGGLYSPKSLLKVANLLENNGLSKVARALQKHGNRIGTIFPKAKGNPSTMNAQAEKILTEILTSPSSTSTIRHHARFGEILEVKIPSGHGARFSSDGKNFIGFIE